MSSKVIAEVISGSRGTFEGSLHISSSQAGYLGLLRVDHEDNSDILFVSGSGRVGVNTNLPNVSLEIATSSIDDSPAIRFTGLRPRIQFYETDQTDQFQIQASNGQLKWQVQNNDFNSASVKWAMNPNGYMAVRDGQTSAAIPSRFYISGSDTENLLIVSGATNPDVLAVLGSGRVGIGTATPAATLDVKGDGTNTQVLFLSGSGASTDPNEAAYADMAFFVSGAIGNPVAGVGERSGRPNEGLSVYGGDLFSSGTVYTSTVRSTTDHLRLRGTDSGKEVTIGTSGVFLVGGGLISLSSNTGNIQAGARDLIRLHTHGAGGTIQIGPKVVPSPTEMVLILSGGGQASPNMANAGDTCFFVSGSVGSRKTSVAGTSVFGGDAHISGSLHASSSLNRGLWTDGYIGNDEFIAVMPSEFNSFPVSGSSIGGNNYPGPYQFGTITRFAAQPSSGSFVEFPFRNNNASATFAYAQKMIPVGFEATGIRINSLNTSAAVVAFKGRIDDGTTNQNMTGFGRPTNADRNFGGIGGNVMGDGAAYVTLGIKLTHFPSAASSPGPIFGAKIYIRRTPKGS